MLLCKNRWGRVSHFQPERKESHSEPVTPLGTGHPMMLKKLLGCSGSPRPWAHHDPPLVSAQARPEAGYSRPALYCRAILTLPIVSKSFPWLSAISLGLNLKPLHYGLACIATFAVLAFVFNRTPPPLPSAPPTNFWLFSERYYSCAETLNASGCCQLPSSDPTTKDSKVQHDFIRATERVNGLNTCLLFLTFFFNLFEDIKLNQNV